MRLHSAAVASRQFGKEGVAEGLGAGICIGSWGGAGRSGGPTWLGAGAEHLRPSHVGGSRNDKGAQKPSSQKEHVQIYEFSKRNVNDVEFEVIAPLRAARPRHRSGRWR